MHSSDQDRYSRVQTFSRVSAQFRVRVVSPAALDLDDLFLGVGAAKNPSENQGGTRRHHDPRRAAYGDPPPHDDHCPR